MSGEALHSTQFTPSSEIAMDDWVRAWARRLPLRKPAQLAQLQFHWGKPPPAADTRIWNTMVAPSAHHNKKTTGGPSARLTVGSRTGVSIRVDPDVPCAIKKNTTK